MEISDFLFTKWERSHQEASKSLSGELSNHTNTPPAASPGGKSEGVWDSIHVFEATDRARSCHYKLTSTVILHLSTSTDSLGEMDLSGNMTRQIEQDMSIEDDGSHIANIGRMVEDMELKMRNLLQEVYFGKAKDVVGDLRSLQNLGGVEREKERHLEMISAMKR